VRQEARLLIGPLVGVAALAITLTACGSSDNEADPVVSPPTTEVTATTAVTTIEETTTTTAPPGTVPIEPVITAAPTPLATAAPKPPAMSAQELESLEAELSAIDAILDELVQNFAAD
jgi:hypothetical protein